MIGRVLSLAVLTAVGALPAQDPAPRRAALAGVIRDSLERPIPLAMVAVDGKDLSTVSDDSGRFHLAGIPAGTNDFTVMRIGFKALSFTTTLTPDTTLVIAIRMRRIQTLEDVNVRAPSVSPRLARTGYYDRKKLGLGSFVTPERVDSLSHLSTPAKLLRDVRGLEVRCGAGGCTVVPTRGHECLQLIVDGAIIGDMNSDNSNQIDNVLTTGAVYAIEVYERPSIVPTEFQGMLPRKRSVLTRKAGCGVVVVWTRGRAER
jgi:hypothetical protein